MSAHVRPALVKDLPDIVRIYNVAVEHSFAVFTETPTTLAERTAWWESRRAAGYPVLVAIHHDQVAGFASFGDFRPWPGYRLTVEHSVYIDATHQSRGLGTSLMNGLFAEARTLGKHTMVAGIEGGNEASLRFHERLGFQRGGTLPGVGYKFGRFLDLTFLFKPLGNAEPPVVP
jgi:L-amino acid N-acyltransferase